MLAEQVADWLLERITELTQYVISVTPRWFHSVCRHSCVTPWWRKCSKLPVANHFNNISVFINSGIHCVYQCCPSLWQLPVQSRVHLYSLEHYSCCCKPWQLTWYSGWCAYGLRYPENRGLTPGRGKGSVQKADGLFLWKYNGMELTTHCHLRSRLRISGAIPQFPDKPSWRSQGKLHCL